MAAVVTDARRKRANLPLVDLKNLRTALNVFLSEARLTVYPDGRFALRIPAPAAPAPPEPAEGSPEETAVANPALDPVLAQRYGLPTGGLRNPAGTPVASADPEEQFRAAVARILPEASAGGVLPNFEGEGTWTRSGDRYTLTFANPPVVREAVLQENGRFVIPLPEKKLTLVFVRAG
jgi:hypothetical protein